MKFCSILNKEKVQVRRVAKGVRSNGMVPKRYHEVNVIEASTEYYTIHGAG